MEMKITSNTTGYLLVPVSGELELLVPGSDSGTTITQAVGGYFECISLNDKMDMWLNEEGKLHRMEWNPRAQALFDASFGRGQDMVVGNVVITGGVNRKGDTQPLDAATLIGLSVILDTVVTR
jgi:Domain of unknown function (DUF3846)